MIRATVLVLALSTTSAFAQDATDGTTPQPVDPTRVAPLDDAAAAAAAEGVTGFVPLVAPALGVAAAAVGVAASGGGGGGSSNSTTSTVGTN
ncbi:hypothetical protein [Ruegeria atlantica]|uniref:hypothetical protein n=1 Tax=Ruegeria atlantica TaxID=81569 RepID=UPI001481846C|nr:hypothetical protein [Ruegeria atlantica]